jgi:hypothetical protein
MVNDWPPVFTEEPLGDAWDWEWRHAPVSKSSFDQDVDHDAEPLPVEVIITIDDKPYRVCRECGQACE